MLCGMPELKLGLKDKAFFEAQGRQARSRVVEFDDFKLHQCLRLSKFENERVIQFFSSDGDFELISYRLDIRIKPIFTVDFLIEKKSATKIELFVKAKSNFKPQKVHQIMLRYLFQSQMMQNNLNLELHMVLLIICKIKKLRVGVLNNLEIKEILQ